VGWLSGEKRQMGAVSSKGGIVLLCHSSTEGGGGPLDAHKGGYSTSPPGRGKHPLQLPDQFEGGNLAGRRRNISRFKQGGGNDF